LDNLTGPGSEEAVQLMREMRRRNPSTNSFIRLLDTRYKNVKLNRHDRRRILELIDSGEFWK